MECASLRKFNLREEFESARPMPLNDMRHAREEEISHQAMRIIKCCDRGPVWDRAGPYAVNVEPVRNLRHKRLSD